MIPSTTASLGLSLANGVLKLSRQLDRLQAEKEAVRGDLALPMPPVSGLVVEEVQEDLRQILAQTATDDPDPIGTADRQEIQRLLDLGAMTGDYMPFYSRLFPLEAIRRIDPDAEFLKRLDQLGLDDEETRLAAFYIRAGDDDRKMGYGWRLGLTVADTLTELGAENTALFVRDPNLQQVARSVLTRFAEPDLTEFDSWKGLLRHTLQATLSGALDARESLDVDSKWVDAVLGALANARAEVAAQNPDQADNFILGLVSGKGYKLLISSALETAAGQLGAEGATAFEKIASELLTQAAPLVEANQHGFKEFFNEHWGDLLRSGLSALETHGPELLAAESPVLRDSLLAIVGQLAKTPDNQFLGRETLLGLADAAIAAVVSHSGELTAGIDEPWLKELVTSVVGVLSDQGVRGAFTRESAQELVRGALSTLAEHPELIARKPGVVRDVVGGILESLSQVSGFGKQALAQAAVEGALQAVSTSPTLLDDGGGQAIAQLAGLIGEQVKARTLTKIQGTDLLRAALSTLADHPELVADDPGLLGNALGAILERLAEAPSFGAQELATAAVTGFLDAVATDPGLLAESSTRIVADFAGFVAEQVKTKTLTKVQGKDLLRAFSDSLLKNPELFAELEAKVAQTVVATVVKTAGDSAPGILVGGRLVALITGVFDSLAARGLGRIRNQDAQAFADALAGVLRGGLTRAQQELGQGVDRDSVPALLSAVFAAWLSGEIDSADPANAAFQELFDNIVNQLAARRT